MTAKRAAGRVKTVQLTRQGVRNLDGPRMDGMGHNGNRSVTCPHHRDPAFPVERRDLIVEVPDAFGALEMKTVNAYYCTGCGDKRWDDSEGS